MPPAVRRVSLEDALAAFAAQAAVLVSWAGSADLSARSAIAGWTTRDVLAHLTVALERLAGAGASSAPPTPVATYVLGYAEAAGAIAIAPADVPGDPRERFVAVASAVADRAVWPKTVVMWENPLGAADAVATRVLELVVHGDDLGVAPAPVALGLVCRLLTGVLATRHPGRAVELRVAPYAAVQVLEGTVHRRGQPTAVVSCDPLPWVRLATGRLSWGEATASGALTARGERSDLSAYLPLLS